MPTLGLSQNSFKLGQNHQFKVFGNTLGNSTVTALTTNVPNVAWQITQQVGHGQNHVEVKATVSSTLVGAKFTDTIGDLTVTVTDSGSGQQATTTFTPVTYTT